MKFLSHCCFAQIYMNNPSFITSSLPRLVEANEQQECVEAIEQSTSEGSTWNLDLLFSGSYLFQSSTSTKSDVTRTRRKVEVSTSNPKPRPTHFLAVRIDDPIIVESVQKAQSDMALKLPQIQGALISPSKLHVTLSVLHLPSAADVELIKSCLTNVNWRSHLAESDQLAPLKLHGIGHFRDSVIYANLHADGGKDTLQRLAFKAIDCIKMVCPNAVIEEEKVDEEHERTRRRLKGREFHPHVTLAKLRGNNYRRNGDKPMRKIDPIAHSHLKDFTFGHQRWSRFQLLAMQWPRNMKSNGYYHVESEFEVVSTTLQ